MKAYWTSEQLRAAIERCEAETARRIANHEPPERIYGARQGIASLYAWLRVAEQEEREHGDAGQSGAICEPGQPGADGRD